MTKRRDDFPVAVAREVRERVGNICSHPDCRKATSSPKRSGRGVIHTGDAAHICAASPKGARYDPTMTPEQRRSIDNAIWLCQAHAREVDHDHSMYSAAQLKQWKIDAEGRAIQRHNGKVYGSQEVLAEVQAGISGFARGPIIEGIARMHQATTSSLEALDPRFEVKSSYTEGITTIEVRSRHADPIAFQLEPLPEVAPLLRDRIAAFVQWGKGFELSGVRINITDSALMAHLNGLGGNGPETLVWRPYGTAITVKSMLLDDVSRTPFETFAGVATAGQMGAHVTCKACNGLLQFEFQISADAKFSSAMLNTDFSNWEGRDLSRLPYSSAIRRFVKHLLHGRIELILEHEGQHLLTGEIALEIEKGAFESLDALLDYLHDAAIVCAASGAAVPFSMPTTRVSEEEVRDVREAKLIAEKKWQVPASRLVKPISSEMTVGDDLTAINQLVAGGSEPKELKIVQTHQGSIVILGHEVILPRRVLMFDRAVAVVDFGGQQITPGITAKMSIKTFPETTMRQEFADD